MKIIIFIFGLSLMTACAHGVKTGKISHNTVKMEKKEKDWKSLLTDEQYHIMIEKGTEKPYSGEYWNVFEDGIYRCAACGAPLFDSDTKYDSHCGWPSFYDALDKTKIATADDYKLGYRRIEIMCANCGAHLGHVFPDGPKPTGLRYCVNSISIKLDTSAKAK